ncbi:putative chorismate pyruvate-lyase [Denitratisoma oestradiolicum]|uniref:Probable chorismate pyruvate-lyase n=2 Tax=Denitratisoma oestradiolicum TaxID=311182 RepID=A0A6S6XNL9_9PROT|nr:putative chorismate pyruvate-lyase [Denitratisoma oestradiolicum]
MRNMNRKAAAPDGGGWLTDLNPAMDGYRPWLAETGSLTARIQRACPAYAPFAVRRLSQGWGHPCADEYPALSLRPGRLAQVREVLLQSGASPVVFAHTVVLGYSGCALARVGGRSLGSVLFSDPQVLAGPLRYRCLDARHALYHRALAWCGAASPRRFWARRALFRRGPGCLLVTEVFLPAILDLHPR